LSERDTQPLPPADLEEGAGYENEEYWEDEPPEELPPRRRLRLVTPLTGALAGLLLGALGFIGGVLVEKGKTSSQPAAPSGFASFARARAGGAGALGGGAGGANATVGQVSMVHGRTLYVTDSQGNTIKVTVPSGETVTRAANSSVRAIHSGDTVIVQGSKGKNGAITASSVRATAASSSGTGSALGQLFGGGGGGGAGGASPGGQGSAGGPPGDVPFVVPR
jgi:hypothetical protein